VGELSDCALQCAAQKNIFPSLTNAVAIPYYFNTKLNTHHSYGLHKIWASEKLNNSFIHIRLVGEECSLQPSCIHDFSGNFTDSSSQRIWKITRTRGPLSLVRSIEELLE